MGAGDRLVDPESPVYREFVRLYQIARSLRPTAVDRWSGNLWATQAETWGGFDPITGDLRLSDPLVLRHLDRSTTTTPDRQAQALATVLHEATHACMETDAPDDRNAVRSPVSKGLMEGIAEVRAVEDFDAFARRAGYPDLPMPTPTYPGAHAAATSLLNQCAGPSMSWEAMIGVVTRGPGALHFDQLADGVLRNRLAEVVPVADRQATRAALIATMTHPMWPMLPGRPQDAGRVTADEIKRSLNAKVEEIRHHYRTSPQQPFPADFPNAARHPAEGEPTRSLLTATPDEAERQEVGTMRFLSGQAPAAHATRAAASSLGDGSRSTRTSAGRATPGLDRGAD
ncbi:hypothetical protein [Kribbella monticola]|uniref:hypothetical protein n=1 Tax=Kribbella monticola TaxID=2185285 RepID=UPI0013006E8A|nr:hypothetical protein [Kribbella monticola]